MAKEVTTSLASNHVHFVPQVIKNHVVVLVPVSSPSPTVGLTVCCREVARLRQESFRQLPHARRGNLPVGVLPALFAPIPVAAGPESGQDIVVDAPGVGRRAREEGLRHPVRRPTTLLAVRRPEAEAPRRTVGRDEKESERESDEKGRWAQQACRFHASSRAMQLERHYP